MSRRDLQRDVMAIRTIRLSWWPFILGGWAAYGLYIWITSSLCLQPAPLLAAMVITSLGMVVPPALIAVGNFILFRRWFGALISVLLTFVSVVAQLVAMQFVCLVVLLSRI